MIKIKKGLDLPISGTPLQQIESKPVKEVALVVSDFHGVHPDLKVIVGERVKRGQMLFSDKHTPGVLFTAPAGGEVSAINRGERRALLSIVIAVADDEPLQEFERYEPELLEALGAQKVRHQLIQSGLWCAFRTRPFSKIPAVDASPFAIVVNAMETAPLAADPQQVVIGHEKSFQQGLHLLTQLTRGKVYLCKAAGSAIPLGHDKRVEVEEFSGPHPAGLSGTHIHRLVPVDRQHVVWSINYQDVIAIGELFTTGVLPVERVISLAGPMVKQPRLIRTRLGASIAQLCEGELLEGDSRIIAGSVLSGRRGTWAQSYLGLHHQQISVIEESPRQELLGWVMPGVNKFSVLNIFLSKLFPRKRFDLSSSLAGSPRAMVPVGSYERVFPLEMMITPLLRALIVGDDETAQQLGCLELDEEDLALCTFVCPGKYDYGTLLREALNRIEKEG